MYYTHKFLLPLFFFSPHNLFSNTYLHIVHSLVESECESRISWYVLVIKTDFNSIVEVPIVCNNEIATTDY